MNWYFLFVIVLVAALLVVLNINALKKRKGTMDLAPEEIYAHLSNEKLENRFKEAQEEYAQLAQWSLMAAFEWTHTLKLSHFEYPFQQEREQLESEPPSEEVVDLKLMWDAGFLWGLSANDKLVVRRAYQAGGTYDELFHVWEGNQRFSFQFEGPHKRLVAFSRMSYKDERPIFYDRRDITGFFREEYRYATVEDRHPEIIIQKRTPFLMGELSSVEEVQSITVSFESMGIPSFTPIG